MKLAKYFRQNSRVFLMIFMSLLLVAFLIPNSISSIGNRDGQFKIKLGQAFGRELTTDDLREAAADNRVLSRANSRSSDADLNTYLLVEEAKRVGVRVGRDQVKGQFAKMDPSEQGLRELQQSNHLSYDQIFDLYGRQFAYKYLAIYQAAGLVDSLPRQEAAYRDRAQQGAADFAVLDDKAFLHLVPEPTPEELSAFFEECKSRKTAHTEDELQFGYLLPDRVRVEYLTVDPAKIKSKVTVQAAQVKRYFEENAQKYTKPDPAATQPTPSGAQPQIPMTFDEAKDRVREDCREARAFDLAQGLVNDMYNDAHRPWSSAVRDSDGFAEEPAGPPVAFNDLKEKFSAKFEVEYGQTDLVSSDKLAIVPGLGGATLNLGRELMRVYELAYRVKGILDKDPNDGRPVLNLNEPAPVVMATRYDKLARKAIPIQAYLFRVNAVAPSGPPASPDEVRDKLVPDWKLMRAHQLAGEYAAKLAARAREAGLKAAVDEAADLKAVLAAADQAASQPVSTADAPAPPTPKYAENFQPFPGEFTRQASVVMRIGRVPNLVSKLFGLTSAPAGETDPKRVIAEPVANQNKWVVAELTQIKPLYRESFDAQLSQAVKDNQKSARDRFIRDWLASANVKERAHFELDPNRSPARR